MELETSIDFRHDVIIDTIQLVIIGSIISTLSMFTYEGIIISILKVLPLLIISIYKSYIKTYVSK